MRNLFIIIILFICNISFADTGDTGQMLTGTLNKDGVTELSPQDINILNDELRKLRRTTSINTEDIASIDATSIDPSTLVTEAEGIASNDNDVTIATCAAIIDYASDIDTNLSEEEVEDYVGGMVTGNTEDGISVTYQDADGTLDFEIDDRVVYIKVLFENTELSTGDGKVYFTVPLELNGKTLITADASVYTVSSSGLPTIQINNVTDSQDMLSTRITIDATEYSSYTAETKSVIIGEGGIGGYVSTGDRLRVDVDVAGTGTRGLDVILTFGVL